MEKFEFSQFIQFCTKLRMQDDLNGNTYDFKEYYKRQEALGEEQKKNLGLEKKKMSMSQIINQRKKAKQAKETKETKLGEVQKSLVYDEDFETLWANNQTAMK